MRRLARSCAVPLAVSVLATAAHAQAVNRQPGGSMKPTILPGARFTTTPIDADGPDYGDVTMFFGPSDGKAYVKRVVGLPGDTVQMQDGILYLNGQPAPQAPTADFIETRAPQGLFDAIPRCANDPVPEGGECFKQQLTETLPNGYSYQILNILDGGTMDDTAEITVPQGHYFVLGDNRDNSNNSRIAADRGGLGMVPVERLIARIDRVETAPADGGLAKIWPWASDDALRPVQ